MEAYEKGLECLKKAYKIDPGILYSLLKFYVPIDKRFFLFKYFIIFTENENLREQLETLGVLNKNDDEEDLDDN